LKLRVEAEVKPTEDPEKVLKAIKNLFPTLVISFSGGLLAGESEDPSCLQTMKELLRKQAIRDAARSYLLGRVRGNRLEFMLNKQVAFCGKVNFTDGESPLGPIRVNIEAENLKELVQHLTS
jgi:predicted RNA binding protein with dsRBD fold (UPF0201 family)